MPLREPLREDQVLMAFFQSVTTRTAGFFSVDQASLSESGTLLTMVLMFIGAGSGSTGGGIKVNTFTVILLSAFALTFRREDVNVFHRRLDQGDIRKASSSVWAYFTTCIVGCMVLCVEGIALDDALFESISAIGTVGLSRGRDRLAAGSFQSCDYRADVWPDGWAACRWPWPSRRTIPGPSCAMSAKRS